MKYWKHDEPNAYKMTKGTKADFVDIWFSANSLFKFEVIARENRTGHDFGSPIVNFTLGNTDSISVTTGNY